MSNAEQERPLRGLLAGSLRAAVLGALVIVSMTVAAAGTQALVSAGIGLALASITLFVGLGGIRAILAGPAGGTLAGAFVVYLGQVILLLGCAVILRSRFTLDGQVLALAAIGQTLVIQCGLVLGYVRTRRFVHQAPLRASQ